MENLVFRNYARLILLIAILNNATSIFAQEYKYGKINKEELEMNYYPNDSTAKAVVLYEEAYTYYGFIQDFTVKTDVKCRIKILTQEGVNEATITIPYYERNSQKEDISGLEGWAYNLVGENIEKTKLEKKYIFEEKITKNICQIKFAIPDVKKGSIIEYKYTLNSPFYYNIEDWIFQRSIPVKHGRYEAIIPEYFIYKIETKGYEKIDMTETSKNETLTLIERGESYKVPYTARDIVFTVNHLPGLKDEPFVWNITDFMSAVHFELSATNFPGSFYKPYTATWENVEKTIKENTNFVKNISKSTPYKSEIDLLKISNSKERIEAIYHLVKNTIRWNGKYAFTGNPSDAVKDGTGDNAQINAALISALNYAGIKTYPILLRRRSEGRLPLTAPSLDKITTFIVAAETPEGEKYYMDGSAIYGGLNMLPSDLLVERGRTFMDDAPNDWINLCKTQNNQVLIVNNGLLTDGGELKIDTETYYKYQPAYQYRKNYNNYKDSTEYTNKIETENHIKIDYFSVSGQNDNISPFVKEHMTLTKKGNKRGDFIYVNPLIIPHLSKNVFTQSERKLPIEFEYPYSIQITTILTIPDGYEVEELPKTARVALKDDAGDYTYYIDNKNGTIQLRYRFRLNNIMFPFTSYAQLKNFWGMAAAKNAEMVVLKKKEL